MCGNEEPPTPTLGLERCSCENLNKRVPAVPMGLLEGGAGHVVW